MPDPPTPIIHPTATRSERFQRPNGVPAQTNGAGPPPRKPKLKKLRLALVFIGLSILAVISTIFGMLMAVASDLPSLENRAQYERAQNSVLYADSWGCKDLAKSPCQPIAKLTGNQNRILVGENEISPNVKNAVIAIEDRRFYTHKGVDYAGIGRAFVQDVLKRRAAQGGSTITQQFVKNALAAQGNRSVFQKLREAALAYHLERKWSKEKILTQYLNTVYFGNGAYGIEAAVRTYFGDGDEPNERAGADDAGVSYTPPVTEEQQDPNAREAEDVAPHEAALLAGMIASPSMYDPIQHPQAAKARRNLVLQHMLEMKAITQSQYDDAIRQSLPAEDDVDPPNTESTEPYFTSWMTEHLLDHYRAGKVFSGGLKVRTTIDPELQDAAERAIVGRLAGRGTGRRPRGDQERHRRGPRDGRRLGLQRAALQPRDQRAPAARLVLQAVHPRARARRRHRPEQRLGLRAAEDPVPGQEGPRDLRGQQLRGLVPRQRVALVGDRHVRQLGLRPARHEGEARRVSPRSPSAWASAPSSPPTPPCCSAA